MLRQLARAWISFFFPWLLSRSLSFFLAIKTLKTALLHVGFKFCVSFFIHSFQKLWRTTYGINILVNTFLRSVPKRLWWGEFMDWFSENGTEKLILKPRRLRVCSLRNAMSWINFMSLLYELDVCRFISERADTYL